MAHHPEPDDQRFTHQSTHPGFNWYSGCTQLGERDDVWYLITNPAVVQVEDWPSRFYANITNLFMVSRGREIDDARLSRIQFLQFNCDCIFRSGRLWNGGYVDLRGL